MYFSTPLLRSSHFPQEVLLKLENTQPSGSFKSRGLTHLIETEAAQLEHPSVFACSGGNAGLAAAEAAAGLGIPCTVVVPTTAKPAMIARIEHLGANVIVHGELVAQAGGLMQELMAAARAQGENPIFCHPFDNPLVWEGHSTMVAEIAEQIGRYRPPHGRPGAIVLSCGGGGLYLGVMKGLEKLGWAHSVPVVVVETEGAPTFHASLAAGKSVRLTSVKTVASSLASVYVPEEAVQYAQKYGTRSLLVPDADAVAAAKRFAADHCMIVEPACSVTLAAIHSGALMDIKGPLVAIVCGGSAYGPADVQ